MIHLPDPMYDVRGNLARDDGLDSATTDAFRYSYDPENRLAGVTYDPVGDGVTLTTMATYRYDALGRRIEYVKYDEAGANPVTTQYYYDGQNAIEEHNGAGTRLRSYVHGTQYVDERAVMRRYDPVSETCQDHYYLLEELYSVAGLAASNGLL